MKLIAILTLFIITSCSTHRNNNNLKLVAVYQIETHNSLEPSGLTLWDGVFYSVSDKHNIIYELEFNNDSVSFNPVIEIENDNQIKFDFEGITHDDNYFYLISETLFKILKVSKDGESQEWINSPEIIKKIGLDAGLFQVNNANIEGICQLKDNSILMVAERQPRGFIEYQSNAQISAYQTNDIKFNYDKDRSPDFSGLSCDDGVYALSRNAYMVAELTKLDGKYTETKGYSYKHIIKKSEFQFQNMDYGHAEGLVVKGNKIYLVLDNNKSFNKLNPENNNSLFLELQK